MDRFINKTDVKKSFGLLVRLYRNKAQLTQEQLAEKANVHPTYISSVERGKRDVGLEKIISIARGLGISAKELMPD